MNKVVPNTSEHFYPNTEHNLSTLFTQLTPATPFVLLILLLVARYIGVKVYRKITGRTKTKVQDITPVQNIEKFYNVLKDQQLEA